MKHTRTVIGVQHWFGFNSILQGYDISAKVYAIVNGIDAIVSSARGTINEWFARSAGRKQLAKLSPHMLRDIGLEPFQVQAELRKPFWKK